MTEVKYRLKVSEELLPMKFGSPLRNPHYEWNRWDTEYDGRSFHELNEEAEQAYNDEWGAKGKVELVTKAALRAGFGDNAQIVRDAAAAEVSYLVSKNNEYMSILFHGAGKGDDAVTVFNALGENEKDRVQFILLEPGETELEEAKAAMKKLGVPYEAMHSTDMGLPDVLKNKKYDFSDAKLGMINIVVGVASMHHHALIPWNLYMNMLDDGGGYLVVADWHVNNLWTPEGVYAMLSSMRWKNREECLREWRKAYGLGQTHAAALRKVSLSPADRDMIRFWVGYHNILKEEGETENAIWPMEGHRSPEKYMTEMAQAGFRLWTPEIEEMMNAGLEVNGKRIETNPHQILDESQLLMLTVAQKLHI